MTALSDTGNDATDDQQIAYWAARLRGQIPDAGAILLKGSHVVGEAGPNSDIDFDVLVEGPPIERYPFWLEPDGTGRLRHVSVAVQDVGGWLGDVDEPEPWAFGLPIREPMRLLWAATSALRERLDRPWREHPPAEPEIEDWLECLGKMRNARRRGDELGLRQAAQGLGRYTPTLLRPLNPPVWATSPRSALDLVLEFATAPQGYRADLLACLGLADRAPVEQLITAGERLAAGTLSLLREHVDTIASLVAPDIAAYLRDGTLERYLESTAAE